MADHPVRVLLADGTRPLIGGSAAGADVDLRDLPQVTGDVRGLVVETNDGGDLLMGTVRDRLAAAGVTTPLFRRTKTGEIRG